MTKPTKTRSEKIQETKAKKAAEAEMKRKEDNIQSGLKRLQDNKEAYENPTRSFKVGEEVVNFRHNGHPVAKVKEVVDGLFYRISWGEGKEERYVPWLDVVAVGSKVNDKDFNTRKSNIHSRFSFFNFGLESLIHKYYYFRVNMAPEYQRGLVWSLEDKVALIDSIFKGIEIGKFAFITLDFKSVKDPMYEILDGKQRLTTLIEFVEDRFPYQGVFYSQLSFADQAYFRDYTVSVGESREQLTPAQKYEYFLRMNTRGVAQTQEHLDKVSALLAKELAKKAK